uniref:Nitrate ABC transporter substrate-binding protein n=1 Tax=Oscillatoriales cyanobacterium SpSt-402 TaxID=2282168 RepID=A0A832H373_9CYAN
MLQEPPSSTAAAGLSTGLHRRFQHIRHTLVQKLKSFWGVFLITLLASVVLHACSIGSTTTLQPLKIGITTWPGFDVVLYAQATGLFEKRGLQIELVRFENQQDSARAVLRGSLDGAFASLWDVMQVDPGTDKPTFFMVTNVSHGADGVVAQGDVKSVEELIGKRIGAKLGTVNHLILLEALKHHGVSPNDVVIEDISNESSAQMMAKGSIDGAVLWEPLLGETAKKSKGNIIFTTKEIDSLVIDGLMTRSTLLQSKKVELTQFVQAWFDVMHAVETKPDEVYRVVSRELGQSQESFASDFAGLKKGDIEMQQRMFVSPGRLKQASEQLSKLLIEDPRHGRLPRKDLEINADLVTAAIAGWKA